MMGSLKVKNDIFYAVLNIKEGGKYKQKWVFTKLKRKGNKWEETEFLNKALREYKEKELSKNTNDILFSDYLIQWLDKKKIKLKL